MDRAPAQSPRRSYPVPALALALLGSAPASAYVLSSVEYAGRLQHPRWHGTAPQVMFVMNDRSLDLLPNLDRAVAPSLAVEAALKSWAVGAVELFFGGMVKTTDAGEDGDNLITFADTKKNRDAVGNNWAVAPLVWTVRTGSLVRILEADIVFSSRQQFAMNGAASAGDVQAIMAHEVGHTLGLEHSSHLAATMFPGISPGETSPRTVEADDRAGLRELYGGGIGPASGGMEGQVQTAAGAPVFGAAVTAVDSQGIPQVSALTDRQGNFTIPALPPGSYQVYAEPLDGPVRPTDLGDDYFRQPSRPLMTRFHTTFAGGNASPASVRVEAGEMTALDPIRVETQTPALNLSDHWWSADWSAWRIGPAPVQPGQAMYLLVSGPGIATWSTGGFNVSGSGVGIDTTDVGRATLDGAPALVLKLWAGSSARPGPRNLTFAVGNQRVILTGAIQVGTP